MGSHTYLRLVFLVGRVVTLPPLLGGSPILVVVSHQELLDRVQHLGLGVTTGVVVLLAPVAALNDRNTAVLFEDISEGLPLGETMECNNGVLLRGGLLVELLESLFELIGGQVVVHTVVVHLVQGVNAEQVVRLIWNLIGNTTYMG